MLLSALQHFLYCPRQCALIHVEQAWAENSATAQGRVLHERVHSAEAEQRPGVRIVRGLSVSAPLKGLTGTCDVVEFHADGRVIPVEYKRGRPKTHRADEVQICGQAICLEETLKLAEGHIQQGFLFYGKQKRRMAVAINSDLRNLTIGVAREVSAMKLGHYTPPAQYVAKLCDNCSLKLLCEPSAMRLSRGVGAWFQGQLTAHLSTSN